MSTHFHDFFTIFFRNPDYRKARYNPIRRLYRAPMNFVEFNILSKLTKDWKKARGYRHAIVTTASFLGLIWTISYYSLYKGNNWTDVGNLKVFFFLKVSIKICQFFRNTDGRPFLANLGFSLAPRSGQIHLRITTKTKMILPTSISSSLTWPKSSLQRLSDIRKIITFWT